VAILLGKRGANVVVNYVGAADRAQETVKVIEAAGAKAAACQADVSKVSEHAKLVKAALELSTTGKIEILVHKYDLRRISRPHP
jgi:NAD(P)-dependent dehydrogenase (short-subunit alcohol dehydrogenase family)